MTTASERSVSDDQVRAINALCLTLGRTAPAGWYKLSHRAAGDLILSLRAETRGER